MVDIRGEPSALLDDGAAKEKNLEDSKRLQAVSEIPLEVTCVLGSSNMTVSQILKLAKGSVIELDRNIGEPIDLLVNGKIMAKGEVIIIEDRIGITLTDVVKEN